MMKSGFYLPEVFPWCLIHVPESTRRERSRSRSATVRVPKPPQSPPPEYLLCATARVPKPPQLPPPEYLLCAAVRVSKSPQSPQLDYEEDEEEDSEEDVKKYEEDYEDYEEDVKKYLDVIETFGGAQRSYFRLQEPSKRESKEWVMGCNTSGHTRLFRVLLSVDNVLEMINKNISVQYTSNAWGGTIRSVSTWTSQALAQLTLCIVVVLHLM